MSAIEPVKQYLRSFKGQRGIYIIHPKSAELLKQICIKLILPYRSDIAYVGKAEKTDNTDLQKRGEDEMGRSNFEGATFVRKIGQYLDYDIKDKKNKQLKENTKNFIRSNFTIECIPFMDGENLLEIETKYIDDLCPCLNVKKTNVKT